MSIELEFKPYNIDFVSTGIQSDICLGEIGNIPAIKKNSGKDLDIDVLRKLVYTIPIYRKSLVDAGLILPDNISVKSTDQGIEVIDKYLKGKDLDAAIQTKDPILKEAWKQTIRQLCDANSGQYLSKAMVDAKPANFVSFERKLFYVDTFPPMLRDRQGLITPWIPQLYKRNHRMMSFNFGDTRGQITKLLAGSKLAYPTMYTFLEEWTIQTIENLLPPKTLTYIIDQITFGFPDMKLFYSNQDITHRIEELTK